MLKFFAEKNVSSFCSAKATHIFSAKNIRILYIESAKTVNEKTLNELVKLTTLWTTGPWSPVGHTSNWATDAGSQLVVSAWLHLSQNSQFWVCHILFLHTWVDLLCLLCHTKNFYTPGINRMLWRYTVVKLSDGLPIRLSFHPYDNLPKRNVF